MATAKTVGPRYDFPLRAEGEEELSEEQALRNVARVVLDQTECTRIWNGRGREGSYARASKAEIASAARQLAEMVLAYLAPATNPATNDDDGQAKSEANMGGALLDCCRGWPGGGA